MRKISKIFELIEDPTSVVSDDSVITNDKVGVEIELENFYSRRGLPELQYWELKGDGSLRNNGIEYVFKCPLAGIDIVRALDEFKTTVPSRVKVSERCSVHVHVDVRDLSSVELLRFVALSVMYENVLFRLAGSHRKKSPFCMPVGENMESVEYIASLMSLPESDIISLEENLRYGVDNTSRYSSFNLQSLRRFGTIEFRMHEGTIDTRRMLRWINVLLSMKEFSKVLAHKWKNIPLAVSESGLTSFTKNVFGQVYEDILYPSLVDDVLSGLRQLQDIIFINSNKEIDTRFEKTLDISKCSELFKSKTEYYNVVDKEEVTVKQAEELMDAWASFRGTDPSSVFYYGVRPEGSTPTFTILDDNTGD